MQFEKFNKIPRLSRDMVITEKIDGSNGQILIISFDNLMYELEHLKAFDFISKYCIYRDKNGLYIFAGSRKRWLDTSSKGDNMSFSKWVQDNAEELIKLGEGRHYGEWYGKGIQRNYGLEEKRFALFNVKKWTDDEMRPKCCQVVPILYEGKFCTEKIKEIINNMCESQIVKGFYNPEGIVIYHKASGQLFKKTIIGDDKPKNA